ncbi:putative membrane protein [Nonlabens sp. Hel1_33_55]|uniref:carotenoid biosynthesis protein n=1 Tax=Nonlabens sp. Hel1_33_55 TaxID=1336802 RepID=UPI000875BD79|nr:carotenoid biosynthesis protein [Nonlabens sp. Hel1_33_55]SCY20418.1 putative membrane protein [Nonlabens sp. Hel1_33_55]
MKKAVILFLWVIHVSALIGIGLGYEDFFLGKSPFTMLYITVLVFAFFPIVKIKELALFAGFFLAGMTVEWLGVHTGWLFGEYSYGENFGPKLDGIPFLIGINWAVLTFTTHIIAKRWLKNLWLVAAVGSGLMVFLDFFLEQICDYAGFWNFTGGASWFNYVCWFVIAFILHLIASKFKLNGDFKISLHIYIVQLIFASILWIIISTT